MSTPISTNVPLVFANLVALEKLQATRGKHGLLVYIISPWIRDVIFPMSEFGICDPVVGTSSSLTSQIITELSNLGVDIRICTLHYFSETVTYKNPLQHLNPAQRIRQADRNLEELDVLKEFQSRGARIFLNKGFHSKVIATSGAVYDGSFNFTLSGYYKNRENGTLISNSGPTAVVYSQKLKEASHTFFGEEAYAGPELLRNLSNEHEAIIKDARKNWNSLIERYAEMEKRQIDRRVIDRRGLVI